MCFHISRITAYADRLILLLSYCKYMLNKLTCSYISRKRITAYVDKQPAFVVKLLKQSAEGG